MREWGNLVNHEASEEAGRIAGFGFEILFDGRRSYCGGGGGVCAGGAGRRWSRSASVERGWALGAGRDFEYGNFRCGAALRVGDYGSARAGIFAGAI